MKHLMICCLVGLLMSGSVLAKEYRTFKSKDGRPLQARIVSVDARRGKVMIEREDGTCLNVKPTVFCKEDQAFINEYIAEQQMMSESVLRISAKQKLVDKETKYKEGRISYGDGDYEMENIETTKIRKEAFVLKLENRGKAPLENLTLEYRVCYKQDRQGKGRKAEAQYKVVRGRVESVSLPAGGKKEIETKEASVFTTEYNLDYIWSGGDPETLKGKVEGLWVKITATSKSGKTLTRTFMDPDDLHEDYTW